MKVKVTFVLPMFLDSPSGGFKVVYEYANRLQQRGHQVTVIHPRNIEHRAGPIEAVKSVAWGWKLQKNHRPLVTWIPLDPEVRLELAPDLRERFIPDGDRIIATAFDTAFPTSSYSANKGRKFYLIQSYEDWNGPPDRVRASWLLPLHKIVISKWLRKIAEEMGEAARTDYIPIGMDFSQFNLTTPIERRTAPRVGMLAHSNEIKGTKDGLAALEIVRGQHPDLQAVLFGTSPRADEIPDWIEYEYRPAPESLQALYNSCQVYLHPSRREGWGLTAAEAMACGCALVSAENGGVHEFATGGESALLAPVKSPSLLARQVTRLLEDDALRHRLAQKGSEQVRRFTWDRAVNSLEQLLLSGAGG